MSLKSTSPTVKTPQLSSKEFAVVRSYMLGLSEETLMQLLQIERFELAQIWNQLFEKFKLNNPYIENWSRVRERLTYLHINDMFLLGMDNVVENLSFIPKHVIRKHLYRVQKLSSKYYEFRLANKYINPSCEFPEYIRINNFGDKKTGWLTHNPVKVKISLTGDISLMNV